MSTLDCQHSFEAKAGRVCSHLLASGDGDYLQHFTGIGQEFDLICPACIPAALAGHLRSVCRACFEGVRGKGCWSGITGLPEIRERPSGLSFRHETLGLVAPLADRILDIQPVRAVDRNLWVAVTGAAHLL